jgi:polyferredoxin
MNKKPIPFLRRAVQLFILAIFLSLFIATTYRGGDEVHYPINVFFSIDPLTALGVLAATKQVQLFFWPTLIIIAATLALGRFFCGWVCPLGSTLDLVSPLMKKKTHGLKPSRNLKYYFLIVLLVAALFSINLIGLFDPISITIRSLSLFLYPLFTVAADAVFSSLYFWDIPLISPASEFISDLLGSTILPFQQGYFYLSLLTFFIFLGIILLEKIDSRFWCRYLCPLGALLSLFSGISFLSRKPRSLCARCTGCRDVCEMDAFSNEGKFLKGECILTLSCVTGCEKEKVSYSVEIASKRSVPNLKRRYVVGSLVSGIFLPLLFAIHPKRKLKEANALPLLLRPPGAKEETEFLARCIKCSECMMACPTGGLQPDLMTGGLEGIYSPILVPRIGYCEYHCTLCGQVCPTDAIEELTRSEKLSTVIGKAYIDTNRCLPYAQGINCLVCEEHCPTYDKAIKFDTSDGAITTDGSRLKKPYVIDSLCVGCGICEFKCPVAGRGAIIVTTSAEEQF